MIPDYMDEIWNASTPVNELNFSSTTNTVAATTTLTLQSVLANIERVKALLGPDPLAEWMRAQGFDPDKGAVLFVPVSHELARLPFRPHYLRVSKIIVAPLLGYDPELLPLKGFL